MSAATMADPDLTDRQKDVLDAALALVVESGDQLTMAELARRASCSKETLYKWFGDRDGMLTAMVRWQASQVRIAPVSRETLTREALQDSLEEFAVAWLSVITGKTSIALNRVAVAKAGTGPHDLGRIVLENGPFAMARRVKPALEIGRDTGVLAFDDLDAAFRTFFGLVVGDIQIRLLLGDTPRISPADIARAARRAARHFFALYGASTASAANGRTLDKT